ncbi:transmembrane amino acid transporter protein-domain-containing protein [Fimicolochytrium jonesii]|uniref:transmembrane amino acid transporter protein-domain-containing protein n=1 Tax=Fimicolochytrium jonesii TaxID=1396493 RepID=UPI0022FE8424|nr:transmembrane amino acid transporter protein-domain-containing protein [Fimicolochytrium jonesii]KAI8821813.1 transmembrane amino acid transporter protein-domain-containing protein [Fimicolochytrium jonesii]
MLAMPSALARVGLGFGIVLIGLSGTAAAFGLLLLSEIASKVGRTSSFNSCAKITYPGAAVWFDVAIAVKCFGVSISYLVICGDLLPRVILGFHPEVSPDSLLLSKTFWLIACLLLVSPLCFLRRLDSLRYTSGFALLSVIYLVFIVVTYFFAPQEGMPPHVHWDEIKWFKLDRHFFGVIPIFVFAFTCHQNIFSVYNELIENEHKRMRKVVVTSVGTAFFVYQTVAVLGYLTFGNTVSSNIIGQYPANALITGGQLAIVFLVLLSYPLQCHPARASLDKIITNLQSHRCAVDEVPALPGEIGRTRWVAMTLGLMGSSLLLALVLHNLATVLAFVGATGSTTICYILPGLFYYKYSTQEDRESDRPARFNPKRAGAIFLGCFGVVIMITSLVTLGVTGEGGH